MKRTLAALAAATSHRVSRFLKNAIPATPVKSIATECPPSGTGCPDCAVSIISVQLFSVVFSPLDMSHIFTVHSPFGLVPVNALKNDVRSESPVTASGSTLRPSGCHVPVNAALPGVTTD